MLHVPSMERLGGTLSPVKPLMLRSPSSTPICDHAWLWRDWPCQPSSKLRANPRLTCVDWSKREILPNESPHKPALSADETEHAINLVIY